TTANTTASNSIPPPFFFNPKMRIWLPITMAGFFVSVVVAPGERRRSRRWLYACTLIAGLILMGAGTPSCGGGGNTTQVTPPGNNGTTPGNYSVTVYAFTESNISNGANSNADASVA